MINSQDEGSNHSQASWSGWHWCLCAVCFKQTQITTLCKDVARMASLGGFPVGVECLALTQNAVFCAIVHVLSPIKIKGQDMNFGRMSL